ncbi:MAG TPA: ice-binding family protein [Acidimicrobiales bacterium]|nr:ice-binding family protein [Acidimicrobiales bacterium]
MSISKYLWSTRRARYGMAASATGLITMTLMLTVVPVAVQAATDPVLGQAITFGILSSTYSNTAIGTTITGDLGYTTGPAVTPTVNGTTHVADSTYNQAGIDQGSALANLNSQACTFTFPAGAVDLATDTSHGTIGIYAPGVYCTAASSAASIGTAGITLTGSGTFIFRVEGALTTVANSAVRLASGASSCDVFWTPTAATTLGATSTFLGTNIDASGITIGTTISWTGRALAFGGTVSTTTDTITVPTCSTPSTTTTTTQGATTTTTQGATPVAQPLTSKVTVPTAPTSPIVPGQVSVTG